MSRPPVFNSPLLLGFDHIERLLDHVAKTPSEGYPPYNIEQIGAHGLRITLAVAGFSADDLTVSVQENHLVIRGRKREDETARVFLYRGIASRQFQRSFVLADGIEVGGASLDNGLLNIDLGRVVPEYTVRTIRIERGQSKSAPSATSIDIARNGDS